MSDDAWLEFGPCAKGKGTSARVMVHPRCIDGPAMAALSAYLESDRKWDFANGGEASGPAGQLTIGPLGTHHRRELVRAVEQEDEWTTYARMDGTQFKHRKGTPAPKHGPEAA